MQLNQTTASGFSIPCRGVHLRRTAPKRREGKGWAVLNVHYSADPDLVDPAGQPTEKLLDLRDRISTQSDWDLEMEIKWEAKSGQLVYPEFDPAIHVIPDDQVPAKLVRFFSLDPHPRTPHAMLWIGADRWDDLYVYREYWPSMAYGITKSVKDSDQEKHLTATVKDYAEMIATLEGNKIEYVHEHGRQERGRYVQLSSGERIYQRFMDQAGKGFVASGENESQESYDARYRRYDIRCQDPNKRHRAGQDAIRELLKPRYHEMRGTWPRLHVAQSCKELILEFQNHRFKITKRPTEERELKQDPVEARSHMLDNLRYLATAGVGYVRGWES